MRLLYSRDHLNQSENPSALQALMRQGLKAAPPQKIYGLRGDISVAPLGPVGIPRLTLVLAGARRITWAEQGAVTQTEVQAGEGIIVTSQAWSRPLGPQFPHRYISIDCYPTFTRFMCESVGDMANPKGSGVFYSGGGQSLAARHLLQALLALVDMQADERLPSVLAVFLQEILLDCRPWEAATPSRHDWHQASIWAHEHVGLELCRESIAASVGIHPNHLSRLCKKYTGQSLSDYLTQLKMRRSMELLRDPALTIVEVMQGAGYRDETHFRKKFKQVCGVTPGQWRQRYGS